jgi:colicin import membrane protein
MRGYLVSVVAMVTIAPSLLLARSDQIPTLDVRPVCRGIASQSADPGVGQGSQTETFQRCMESEQSVREQLKRDWPAFSAADKQHCVTLAMTGGESSNTELLTCLEIARDVRTLRSAAAAAEGDKNKPASSPATPAVQPAPATPTVQPAPAGSASPPVPAQEPRKTEADAAAREVEQAKADAQAAKAAEALAQRKLADAAAALERAKEETGRAKAEAQAARDSEAAVKRKLADAETARVTAEKACRPGVLGRLRGLLKRPSSNNP